jgi:hypothetical protein
MHCLIAKTNDRTINYIEAAHRGSPSQDLGDTEAQLRASDQSELSRHTNNL